MKHLYKVKEAIQVSQKIKEEKTLRQYQIQQINEFELEQRKKIVEQKRISEFERDLAMYTSVERKAKELHDKRVNDKLSATIQIKVQ